RPPAISSPSSASAPAKTTASPSWRRWLRSTPPPPKLLVWDNAPPHHPKRVQAAAAAGQISIAWLPFRSPELNPDEDLWRLAKAQIAANRPYSEEPSDQVVQTLAEQTVHCIAALSPLDRLRCSGLLSSKFQWLSTYVLITGCRWQVLQRDYGAPTTVWRRLKRWGEEGVWERIWRATLATLDQWGGLDWTVALLVGAFVPPRSEATGSARRARATG
ncbi:MAG TPA: transposase, partial [Ktedonobacterales bacterium]|nr:transposase [Ktedonobacterales bacterium]